MSPGVSTSCISGPDQVLLRWSDSPDTPSREQFVQMIESHSAEAVIRSSSKVGEKTKVHLIGRFYTANGIVRSCMEDGSQFIVTILMLNNALSPETENRPAREPGLLSVESWLTEEAENRILDELDESTPRRGLRKQFDLATRSISLLKLQSFHISLDLVKIIRDLQNLPSKFLRTRVRISCPELCWN